MSINNFRIRGSAATQGEFWDFPVKVSQTPRHELGGERSIKNPKQARPVNNQFLPYTTEGQRNWSDVRGTEAFPPLAQSGSLRFLWSLIPDRAVGAAMDRRKDPNGLGQLSRGGLSSARNV
jgi:hypothetical protein